jgi:hypothetical protein
MYKKMPDNTIYQDKGGKTFGLFQRFAWGEPQMDRTRTLLTSNNNSLGPGHHGVTDNKNLRESKNKHVFLKG